MSEDKKEWITCSVCGRSDWAPRRETETWPKIGSARFLERQVTIDLPENWVGIVPAGGAPLEIFCPHCEPRRVASLDPGAPAAREVVDALLALGAGQWGTIEAVRQVRRVLHRYGALVVRDTEADERDYLAYRLQPDKRPRSPLAEEEVLDE